jgi:hypothetical protein
MPQRGEVLFGGPGDGLEKCPDLQPNKYRRKGMPGTSLAHVPVQGIGACHLLQESAKRLGEFAGMGIE